MEQNSTSRIKVTVICTTYNHEKYIEQCLLSIANQKTDFAFKVIVHDDASTDNTQTIIDLVVANYPDLFVTVLQKENQYSKGIHIAKTFLYPLIEGDYVAHCEGDDYWCDPLKLQRQVDFLDNNIEYSACVHNTQIFNMSTQKTSLFCHFTSDCDAPIPLVLSRSGAVFHTSSLVCRTQYEEVPDSFFVKGIGDYPKAVYLALCGKIRFLSQVMSVYRFGTEGSWTKRQTNQSQIINNQRIISMLRQADEYSQYHYTDSFSSAIKYYEYKTALRRYHFKLIRNKFLSEFQRETLLFRIKHIIKCILFTCDIKFWYHML